jgi:uncharacterized protein
MYIENENLISSPTDLTLFLKSPFASWMTRFYVEYPDVAPPPEDESDMTLILSDLGTKHEHKLLENFLSQGLNVAVITPEGLNLDPKTTLSFNEKVMATIDAMECGVDVIFQAALSFGFFRGYADFLVKVPCAQVGGSRLGNYAYDVWDTKLSTKTKPAHLVQLCCYAEMLSHIQGGIPHQIVVALGSGQIERYRTNDFFYYYLALKNKYIKFQDAFNIKQMPDPADSKTWGRWETYAKNLLESRDHLISVANITNSQIKRLNRAGILTSAELAASDYSSDTRLDQIIFDRLKRQAKIQKLSVGKIPPLFEVIRPNNEVAKVGLALLPPHSDLDVFFDIEGYPLEDGGLEYLWGAAYLNGENSREYIDFWAHDHEQEKKAFIGFIDWAYKRWLIDPRMHIYHYANYEISACRKLMGKYGIKEHEVDQLLRNEVFVDVYKIVKNGLFIGEPKYSIKNVEHLYRPKRATQVASGEDSIIVYGKWLSERRAGNHNDSWETSNILKGIRDYNIDDCYSTQELVAWLRVQQSDNNIRYCGQSEIKQPEANEEVNARTQLRDRMIQMSLHQAEPNKNVTENLAWLLEYHRRELKPVWWRLFDRLGMTDEELIYDIDCIAACLRTETAPLQVGPRTKKFSYEYKFDVTQEFKPLKSEKARILNTKQTVDIDLDRCDFAGGIIFVQSSEYLPDFITLIPFEYIRTDKIDKAIHDVVIDYERLGYESFSKHHGALSDFLFRRSPNIFGRECEQIFSMQNSNDIVSVATEAILNLNNSYLAIQGPPGSGKTYAAKNVIATLVKNGKRIGITSNTHKAINHLLIGAVEECLKRSINVTCCCTKNTDEEKLAELNIAVVKNPEISQHLTEGCIIGTTAWGFVLDELIGQFDYLFIDEAGQVPLANLVAMSRCTKNIILLGDQMQLGQPTQGSHPAKSGNSILNYLLDNQATIPDSLGIFLPRTYRMHSAVNSFISNAIYEGKLISDPDNDKQIIAVPDHSADIITIEAGILFVPVTHTGNTQASDEEIEKIQSIINELLGRTYTNKINQSMPITLQDILVIAPYNHQVNKLKDALGKNAKIGTVDKFQGQEAPVLIYSLCSSDPYESPRGADFLFDKHRINVAISRAKTLAIIVGSPTLLCGEPSSVHQMKNINVLAMAAYSFIN